MEVYLPWALFAGAAAAAMLFLQVLPEVYARRRWGGGPGLEGRLRWVCLAAIAGLFIWPFFAGEHIRWPGSTPSIWGLGLMTLAALGAAFLAQLTIMRVVTAQAGAMTDEEAAGLMTLLKRFNAGVAVALPVLTVAAYWTLRWDVQSALCGRYYC